MTPNTGSNQRLISQKPTWKLAQIFISEKFGTNKEIGMTNERSTALTNKTYSKIQRSKVSPRRGSIVRKQ